MAYTTIDDPSLYFTAYVYSGTGSDRSFSDIGFQPDWIWIKQRNGTGNHRLIDSVRGANKLLYSTGTNAEDNDTSGVVSSFDSNGYSTTNEDSTVQNTSGETYVNWLWKAGTSFSNDASATSIGTIDSSGSANQTAGISICSYTGNQTSGASIKHGLSTAPKTIFIKKRSAGDHWTVLTQTISLNTHLHLSQNNGAISDPMFTNTAPTTSVFTVDSDGQVNGNNDTFIAYCFSPIKGYSKFGKYTGNGNVDGPFIYTGFRPAWVMTKRTDSAGDWAMMDNKRPNEFNVVQNYLKAQATDAEQTDDSFNIDICATGFKCRYNNGNYNADGGAYVYWAFAEVPTVNSNGAPANAR